MSAGHTMTDTPKPGIYENVRFDEYLSWNAISNSRINTARLSLAHFRRNVSLDPSPALQLGSLVHCGQLEPMALAKRYAVMPAFERDPKNVTKNGERSFSKTTVYYQNKCEEFQRVNEDKEIVGEDAYDRMVGIVSSICAHEQARSYLTGPGKVEIAIVWNDPETGLLCKARLDKFSPGLIADLKTYSPRPGNRSPRVKFLQCISDFGYHRQMAHYQNGVRVLTGEECDTALVVVDSTAPYCVMAAPMSEEWLSIGRSEVSETLQDIAAAYESDNWPGYESPKSWVPPAWYGNDGEEIQLTSHGQSTVL